jgi:hypothetical protein
MTDDKDDLIRQLTIRLRETVDENDKLRALVANLTEGASAHDTLSELHRNRDLPAAIRAKAAIGCLGVETPRLESVPPAIDATCEEIRPLAVIVEEQRARMNRIQALPLSEREKLVRGVTHHSGDGNGRDDSSSND